eukprot:11885415-Alexandrium_andersonii.AAC.1
MIARSKDPAKPKPKRETLASIGVKFDRLVARQVDLAERVGALEQRRAALPARRGTGPNAPAPGVG